MHEYTQTNTVEGNCWQTAIACVLEVRPSSMPCQTSCEADIGEGRRSYHNALCEYLIRHHRLMYFELQTDWQVLGIQNLNHDGYHLLTGPTVRTPDNGFHHVVVGKAGAMVWDPHPSRDGLTRVKAWGLLTNVTTAFVNDRLQRRETVLKGGGDDSSYYCYCPKCGGT